MFVFVCESAMLNMTEPCIFTRLNACTTHFKMRTNARLCLITFCSTQKFCALFSRSRIQKKIKITQNATKWKHKFHLTGCSCCDQVCNDKIFARNILIRLQLIPEAKPKNNRVEKTHSGNSVLRFHLIFVITVSFTCIGHNINCGYLCLSPLMCITIIREFVTL